MVGKIAEIFKDGLWTKNPGLVQLLGLCPLLAVTSTATNALGLGLATITVLTISNVLIAMIRRLLREEVRIIMYHYCFSGNLRTVMHAGVLFRYL